MKKLYRVLLVLGLFVIAGWSVLYLGLQLVTKGSFDENAIRAQIEAIGPSQFRLEVLSLTQGKVAPFEVEARDWPPSVQRLHPLSVKVAADGVLIFMQKRFVESRGIYITKSGDPPDDASEVEIRAIFKGIYSWLDPG